MKGDDMNLIAHLDHCQEEFEKLRGKIKVHRRDDLRKAHDMILEMIMNIEFEHPKEPFQSTWAQRARKLLGA